MIRIYTTEEIDNIIQAAYNKGREEGFEAGIEQMECEGY